MCDPDTCPRAKRERDKRIREIRRFVKDNPCPNYVNKDGMNGNHTE